jgi:hypothetical protein
MKVKENRKREAGSLKVCILECMSVRKLKTL